MLLRPISHYLSRSVCKFQNSAITSAMTTLTELFSSRAYPQSLIPTLKHDHFKDINLHEYKGCIMHL